VAFLALALVAHRIPYFPIDLEITRALQGIHTPWLEVPFSALNAFGFAPIVTIAFALVILVLFVLGRRWEAASAGMAALGAVGLANAVKWIVGRPRPSADLVHVAHHLGSPGFPAGHVVNLTPFAGFLCYLAYARLTPSWRRTALITLLLVAILMMGPARVHDGEHWPSDVLGAYLLGLVWLSVVVAIYERGRRRRTARTRARFPTLR
jgi:undecaprenyl-diphosphatase